MKTEERGGGEMCEGWMDGGREKVKKRVVEDGISVEKEDGINMTSVYNYGCVGTVVVGVRAA